MTDQELKRALQRPKEPVWMYGELVYPLYISVMPEYNGKTQVDTQEALRDIVVRAKAGERTTELYGCVRQILGYADVFKSLQEVMTTYEYEQFDLEYCEHFRPGQKKLAKYIKEKRGEEEWREKKKDFLQKKRQLLRKRLHK